jgi:HSP20 family protein
MRALEAQLSSDWLQDSTASRGAFPPINLFQQGDDLLAVVELPGIDKDDLQIQAKENTIRISGKKAIAFPEGVSVHRRERIVGEFDRTLSIPVRLDASRIKAEYRDGILALYLPRAESDKPRRTKICSRSIPNITSEIIRGVFAFRAPSTRIKSALNCAMACSR